MQVAVFVRWANSLAGGTVRELSDIVDTKFLSIFVQLITGDSFISSGSRIQDISNALRLIDSDECFSQINISELIDGNPRVICSIVWQLIQVFWRRFAPADVRDQKMVEALKDWCAERAQRFGVQINDFISSWRDGYALNAILLSYNPELFNMNQIKDMRAVDRIEHAMSLAKRDFSTPRLLQPKDFSSEHLDKKSVVCYLMVLYLSLLTEVPSSESELEPQPFEQPTESLESSKSSQSSMITRQKIAVKSNSQSMIDSVSSSGETIQTEIEYPLETNLEQIPSTSSSRRQSQQTSENFEIQSCKSSTSSQKSARRHGKSMEETIVEFEECLEHVLAWLLEAEEQANCMKSIEKDDVELVKSLFKEHEMFMQSLTESQDGVGRVLHRGQQLVQKMEEEEAAAIVSQLLMVNTKWERIREISMLRQNQLQHCLNSIQIEQLESIRKWLDSMEEEIKNAPPLTMNGNEIRQLIDTHAAIQNRIENEQKIVRGLSTFVAVVDESDSHFSYENLEKLLQSVGQRWMNVCEWAEMRARQLNGLSELIPQYTSAYHKILESLDNWEGVS
ncbi:unnamed protein product [Cercopithifilaria johnstoni]|uniref:Calponin-homology (CH) domain-containing protein n=1 Tax=Cercopithifilaria johnstoni TaxID=2874296 RepID=A0A8J2MS65_9BILA|nr:unnamed protein product [Cercopithifilaria johnstoni]